MSSMLGIDSMTQAQGQKAAAEEAAGSAKMAAGLQYWQQAQTNENMAPWLTAGQGAVNALWSGIQQDYGLEAKQIPMSEEEYVSKLPTLEKQYYNYRRAAGRTFEELVPESKRMKTTYVSPSGLGGPSFEKYQKSPYYNFLLQEGTNALEKGAASKGKLFSGQQQKGLAQFGQNLASTDYDAWLRRWYQSLTPLQSLAGLGQTTGSQLGALGAQSATAQGNALQTAGVYSAAGKLGQANTMANTMGSQSNQLMNLLGQSGLFGGGVQQSSYVPGMSFGNFADVGVSGLSGAEMDLMNWL